MKPSLGAIDYLKKISSRIVLVMGILAISIICAAYDRYYFKWGKEGAIVLLGLLIGVVICIVLEYLDHTLRTGTGVKHYAKLPFMGEVPPVLREDASGQVINMIAHLKPDAMMAEAFRNIRVNLLFAASEGTLGALMIGSSALSEGKSFVASNLAIAFTQAHRGEPTLLIDADMRKGKLGDLLGGSTEKGLSTFLKGESSLDDSIVATTVPNLSLMSSGPHVGDPSELLKSEKLGELIQSAKAKFPRVVIDVPAVLDSDDILAWAEKCDNLLFVIGSGFTPLEEVNSAKKKLEGKAEITGAVLNNVAMEADVYYYWSYFKYYWQNKLFQAKHKK